ncbi:MAG: glycosyltransferase family 2 protein [Candidatus Auribacterota bacterium]
MPDKTDPTISIILPVYNRPEYTDQALASIRRSTYRDYEIIVVDDCSGDETIEVIKKHKPDVFIRNDANHGPFYCRNIAAGHARGKILYFSDTDVVIAEDTLAKVHKHLIDDGLECVIGLYSIEHPNKNLCSIYKNSWIRHSYLQSGEYVNWFFTAVGAVRKDVWDKNREFDNQKSNKTGSGDIVFGRSLAEHGVRILLDRQLEVIHLKHFNIITLLENDFLRAYGWSKASLDIDKRIATITRKGFANVSTSFLMKTFLSGVMTASIAALFFTHYAWTVLIASLLIYTICAIPFLRFMKTHFSLAKAVLCLPLMIVDTTVCGFGIFSSLVVIFFSRIKKALTT